ncbi:MAG TPA: ABC transporter permease [Bryobacteraceae bacterium]|nr:ABC transporter permease [Bryobacteraceae bacterium]
MSPRRYLDVARMRLRTLMQQGRVDQELDRELRFHLEQQTEENLAAGMPRAQARLEAQRRLGGVAQIEEECRDMRRTNYIESFWRDLQYALRTLRKSPGFTIVILLTLALSIGANSAIFSVIDGVLLRPLPYPGANRIVRVFFHSASFPKFPLNPFDFRDFRARLGSFDSMAGFTRGDLQLSGAGRPEQFTGFRITSGYFQVLGLSPARGREFNANDEIPGNGQSVIVSDRMWRTRFASDPNILGRKVTLDAQPFTIVGVVPPGTEHPGNAYHSVANGETVDLWWPFTFAGDPNQRGSHYLEVIARMKPGVSTAQAQAEMNAVIAQMRHAHPGALEGWQARVVTLYQEIVGPSERLLLVLLGAVGLVVLIACANAANLLLARAMVRQREIAVRTALGAGRSRLVQQMLTESLLLALMGAACALAVAVAGTRMLVAMLPAGFPRASAIHVNATVFGFTLLIALATGFLFGLAPALQAAHADVQDALRAGGRGAGSHRAHLRLRNALVVGEVSLACLLLIGAGLMLRSFVKLLRTDPGFRPQHLLTATVSLPDKTYKPAEAPRFWDRLSASLGSTAGIRAAGIGTDLPWTGYDDNIGGFLIEGKKPPTGQEFHGRYHVASPDYFRTVGIPLMRGRFFTAADGMKAPPVMIINQSMARRYWPGEDPVGRRIAFDDHPKESDWMTVVGVVGDVKDRPTSPEAENAFWWAMDQTPVFVNQMCVAVRGSSDAALLANDLREAVRQLDPTLAVANIQPMDDIADANVSTPRFALFLVALFAGLALTLAAIGIYGVISYAVSQRTREFGLRMALGAQSGDVLRLVLRQGAKLALLGVALGLGGALALSRLLGSLLYEVHATDPVTFAAVAAGATAVAALACYLPARRATAVDPAHALRSD